MKRVFLAISSAVQLCVWAFAGLRHAYPEEIPSIAAMIVSAAATLALAFLSRWPRRIGVVAALAHLGAIALYLLPAFAVGGECVEGVLIVFMTGLFVVLLLPAVVSAVLVSSLAVRQSPQSPGHTLQ